VFLKKVLPTEGLYCVAQLLPKGGFKHYFQETLAAAQKQLDILDTARHTCYIAQATYDTAKVREAQAHNKTLPRGLSKVEWKAQAKKARGQSNALLIKNFFLDIDCGEKWPLKDQMEGLKSLKEFVSETGLPFPAVVNSGNGLYAHWILEEAIPAEQWRTVAFVLKRVVAAYSPKIGGDTSRTSDSASVLRPPGVTNRKPGHPEKKVVLLKDAEPIQFLDFVRILNTAAKRKKINRDKILAPKPSTDINADFFGGLEQTSTPSDAAKIADKCAQLRLMRSEKGDVGHQVWFFCLGVLIHCADGDTIVYKWTDEQWHSKAKDTIEQWHSSSMGPSTCASFGDANPQPCIGCPHNGRVKSPIVLGRPDPVKKEIPEEQCSPPDGFRRGKDGLFAEEDGRWVRFYDQDLYPERLAYDESLGYEVTTIKHSLPHEGAMECTFRSSIVNDQKTLLTTLADNHIKVVGVKEKKYMVAYLEGHMAKLQRSQKMSLLLCQMGWKKARNSDPMFVLGKKIFHADGRIEDASMAKNVPKAAEAFHCKGSLQKWSDSTRVLDMPGMEPFAFALLAGGFGAPLMKFTGFDGAMISLTGKSGAGKTLMLRHMLSVWGYHNGLMMLRGDTDNGLVSRLGAYGNLPMAIDEVTNIDGIKLSDLAYRITQGRDKVRLQRNATERDVLNTWNTLAVVSTNSSLVDKLSSAKHDASAEMNRIFEYSVKMHPEFQGKVTEKLYWALHENYGHAGVAYTKWMVRHVDEIKLAISKVREHIDCAAKVTGEERFISAIAAVAIYGGMVAHKLGLIQFDVPRVMTWASGTILNMRGDKQDLTGSSVDILAQFIDAHAANRLIVKGDSRGGVSACIIIEAPRGSLDLRYEIDSHRLYISRSVFKAWVTKRYGSYTQIKNDLLGVKALLDPNKRKVLGAGTHLGGAQQVVWEIDMRCKHLSRLVEGAKVLSND
jgi:hypothetical protein